MSDEKTAARRAALVRSLERLNEYLAHYYCGISAREKIAADKKKILDEIKQIDNE